MQRGKFRHQGGDRSRIDRTGPLTVAAEESLRSVAASGLAPLAYTGIEIVILVPSSRVCSIFTIVAPGMMPGPLTVSPTLGVSSGLKKIESSESISAEPNVMTPVKGAT